MKSRRTLLVRTGHGSAAASAVPGLPEAAPGVVPDGLPGIAPEAGTGSVTDAARDAVVGVAPPAEPSAPLVPPDLPPVFGPVAPGPVVLGPGAPSSSAPGPVAPPWVAPAPIVTGPVLPMLPAEPVLPVVPVQSVRPAVPAPPVVPPRPVEPPAVPAPPAAVTGGPAIEPLFTSAPGLNWAGPGDQWSRAWALRTLGGAASPDAPPDASPVASQDASPVAQAPQAPAAPTEPRDAAELPPTARDIELIRTSLAVVEPVADRATAHFYALIFLGHPEIRALFPAAMDVQRDRLFRALLTAARSAGDPEGLGAHRGGGGGGPPPERPQNRPKRPRGEMLV
ncbi:hypothetical protein ACFVZ3_34535, partial [Kitasatospora purpeofusca]